MSAFESGHDQPVQGIPSRKASVFPDMPFFAREVLIYRKALEVMQIAIWVDEDKAQTAQHHMR